MKLLETYVSNTYLKLWLPTPWTDPLVMNFQPDQKGNADVPSLEIGWLSNNDVKGFMRVKEIIRITKDMNQ